MLQVHFKYLLHATYSVGDVTSLAGDVTSLAGDVTSLVEDVGCSFICNDT